MLYAVSLPLLLEALSMAKCMYSCPHAQCLLLSVVAPKILGSSLHELKTLAQALVAQDSLF